MNLKKVLIIVVPILVIGYFVAIKVNASLKIDSCLDSGGRWNYSKNKCEYHDSTSYKSYDSVHTANFGGLSTLVIKSRCAIIFGPDSDKIKKNKIANEEAFYTAADDAMFYTSQAQEFLKTKDIRIVQTDSRIMNFYFNNQMIAHIDLNKQPNLWGTILFNGTDSPAIGNLIDIESDFNKVMKVK
jgi:hypothetical protein